MPDSALEKSLLYDFYGELLSEKQRDAFDLYYNDDLSLAEIAVEWGTSRQNVFDALKKAESAVAKLEAKTGLVRRYEAMTSAIDSLDKKLTELRSALPESARGAIDDIRADIERLRDGI
ncbi:MAG: DNA-binding protein [Oscillospiraceae bacterium]|nr:DNA-binding protein [Oscillospiraceae bacterium]